MGPVLTDAELLSASVAGDAAAWDTLVARYARLVYSIGLREGLDEDEATEVVEGAFLALLDASDGREPLVRPASWLVTMARQEIGRVERNRAERGDVRPAGRAADSASGRASAAHRVTLTMGCEWDRVVSLHQALAQLPPDMHRTIDRAYLDHARPPVGAPMPASTHPDDAHDATRSSALDRLRLKLTEENHS